MAKIEISNEINDENIFQIRLESYRKGLQVFSQTSITYCILSKLIPRIRIFENCFAWSYMFNESGSNYGNFRADFYP